MLLNTSDDINNVARGRPASALVKGDDVVLELFTKSGGSTRMINRLRDLRLGLLEDSVYIGRAQVDESQKLLSHHLHDWR